MNWGLVAFDAAWPPVWALVYGAFWGCMLRQRPVLRPSAVGWLSAGVGDVLGAGSAGNWPGMGISVAHALVGLWLLWRDRRRRDRAPRTYGAKSRALLAALVRKAREATRPRPVLRPVPGGAR